MKPQHLPTQSASLHTARRSGRGRLVLVLALVGASWTGACAKPNTKSPAIDSMGSPGIAWSNKSEGMRMGFMAAVIHPRSQQLFVEFDDSYEEDFTCETCHGMDAELNDYEMPSESLYALPRENALEESMEYDPETTEFMRDELTAKFNVWFNEGEGPKTEVTCFACHPVDE